MDNGSKVTTQTADTSKQTNNADVMRCTARVRAPTRPYANGAPAGMKEDTEDMNTASPRLSKAGELKLAQREE